MSYLKQVMEMFELKDMQVFNINNYDFLYRFNLEYNEIQYYDGSEWIKTYDTIVDLINGKFTINREWKPQRGDWCWYVDFTNAPNCVKRREWIDNNWHIKFKNVILFKTKEQALECADRLLEVAYESSKIK